MLLKLFFIRKIKALFFRFRIHFFIKPFEDLFLNLIYISKLSNWISHHRNIKFNDFYNKNVKYENRFNLHKYVIDNELKDGEFDFFEFGVAEGISFKWWTEQIQNPNCRFYGFDVFTGLPEDFGIMKKKHYDTKGTVPDIKDERIKFISGLFQDSVPDFLKNYESLNRPKVFHLDADLYSSTLYILTYFYPIMREGDIIIFDEFGVPTHEFKAFSEFISAYKFNYEVIGAINNYLQLAIKIKK